MAEEGSARKSKDEIMSDMMAYLQHLLLIPSGAGKGVHEWAMGWMEAERGGVGACHEVGVFELSRGRCGTCSNCKGERAAGRHNDEDDCTTASVAGPDKEGQHDFLEVLLDLDGYPEGSPERAYGVVRKTALNQPHLEYYEQQLLSARPTSGKMTKAKANEAVVPNMLFAPLAALGLGSRRDQPPPGEALCADLPTQSRSEVGKQHSRAVVAGKPLVLDQAQTSPGNQSAKCAMRCSTLSSRFERINAQEDASSGSTMRSDSVATWVRGIRSSLGVSRSALLSGSL